LRTESLLSVRDHLTHPQAISFWARYFNEQDINVKVEAFNDAVMQEFMVSLIKPTISKLKKQSDFEADQDEIIKDLQNEIARKVSIDQKKISMNALELFTRDLGLEKPLENLVSDCFLKQKAKKSLHLNDTIMTELLDV